MTTKPAAPPTATEPDEELQEAQGPEQPAQEARRSGPPAPGVLSVALALVMVLSVVAVFFGAFAFGLSSLQEQRSQHQLYSSLRGLLDPASTTAPWIGGNIPTGAPIALLNAPQIALKNLVVVEGSAAGQLEEGPGHVANTPLPGQPGNSVILGKAATAGAPFAHVSDLRRGDVVRVRTGQGLFTYRVRGLLVNGGRLPTIPATSGLLLLGTSAGSGSLAGLSPSHVVYVVALLQGKAAPVPQDRPSHVTQSQLPGHDEPAAWWFVALWGVALLAVSAACWWLWSTWGLLRTWVVGAPVLLCILWLLSEETLRLLPNVY
ncbi:MAG TPA: class E sortase [Acidimicrobiales bacterium]|nr:class E sortase [Acidimicrobiales bacterium]